MPHQLHNRISLLRQFASSHPLGYRMTRYVIGCSLIFVFISTSAQLMLSYRKELRVIDQQSALISSSYTGSLAKSLWDLDYPQIQLQLKGILNLPDVMFLELTANGVDGLSTITLNQPPGSHHRTRSHPFDLLYTDIDDGTRQLGRLSVVYDLEAIQYRILRNGMDTLLIQALLVITIALALLWLFHRQITRHLEAMADYSRKIAAGALDCSLDLNRRRPHKPDELDALATALNEMRLAIQQDIQRREEEELALRDNRDQLQVLIEHRTESLRKAKEAAEDANSAKSQFLSTMSHEIRTPMNGMLGMIQLLKKSPLNSAQREQVDVLYEACDCLLETFNHVLQYGRLVEGAYTAEKSDFSLQRMLHSLIQLMQAGAEGKELTLELEIDPALADNLYGAANPLRQILTNLLSNAIKFTDRGCVRLRAELLQQNRQQQQLRLVVEDTGIGISPGLLEHIFDRFTQADESITRRFGGTGLGLAICKELANVLEGRIGVASTPGEGSRFWLELPLTLTEGEKHEPAAAHRCRPLSILLVEDVELNRRVAVNLLESQGHKVDTAGDGDAALRRLNQSRYDLILMDMHLPGISGLELTERITSNTASPNCDTPIVALTASVRPESVSRYLRAGICQVIAKPVREELLLATLAEVCDGSGRDNPEQRKIIAAGNDPAVQLPLVNNTLLTAHRRALGRLQVAELLRSFLDLYQEIRPALESGLTGDDPVETAELAHKLAGACDTLGLLRASDRLRTLEQQAESRSGQWQALMPETLETLEETAQAVERLLTHTAIQPTE